MRYTMMTIDSEVKTMKRMTIDAQIELNWGQALIYDHKERRVYGPTANQYAAMSAEDRAKLQETRLKLTRLFGV